MKILLLSYDSGVEGSVTSEWLNDKVMAFTELGHSVKVVTNLGSTGVRGLGEADVIRVASLGFEDFSSEITEAITPVSASTRLLANTLGRVIDRLFRLLAGSRSDGRWSWSLAATAASIREIRFFKPDLVFSTGGPSSAHLAGALISMITRTKVAIELQDPMIGDYMGLKSLARRGLLSVESFIYRNAHRIIYVTEAAKESSQKRHPSYSRKMHVVYPGSQAEPLAPLKARDLEIPLIRILHTGTLYGSRNLQNLFSAVDVLLSKGVLQKISLRVINVGADYSAESFLYKNRLEFEEQKTVPRSESLRQQRGADFLLLVQHTDERSLETIPFKFYDYLNSGVPIIALTNNPELSMMVESAGGYSAPASDVVGISETLARAVDDWASGRKPTKSLESIRTSSQVKKLIELCAL